MIMLRKLTKYTVVIFMSLAIVASGFNPAVLAESFINSYNSADGNVVDKIFLARQNSNVIDNFRTSMHSAEAAIDPDEMEYMVDIGPINGTATSGYVYAAFFNPSGSGRTAVIKRIAVRSNAVGAANYVNLSTRRITASSGGTEISAANIPKKNSDSVDPVTTVRYAGPTVTQAGVTDSRILGQPMAAAAGHYYSARDIAFGTADEKIVLQPGEGISVYQEAAGSTNQRIRVLIEWEEVVSAPSAQNEFLFAFPRTEVAAAASYVHNSFFNPGASGKTAIVKRIWFGAETCDNTAVYTNTLAIRRISASSGGTQITASNVPKKHTGSANSVMDFRRSGVTVTQVGGDDAAIGLVTPCGAAGQAHSWQELNFHNSDEKLILQPGQGIALRANAVAGDVDQLIRMIIEWQEVDSGSTPASQGEYMFAYPQVAPAVAPVANTTFHTFFNPGGSGRTAVVKRIGIRVNASAAATYSAFNIRRITAASGGVSVAAADMPKKHTGTANSVIEARFCGATCGTAVTATYAGTADSRLLSVNGAGAVGQVIGQNELVFGANEKLILQPGEGVGFYIDVATGDIDHRIKMFIEWDEEVSAPSSDGEYVINIGPVNGSTSSGYVYGSFFNPGSSGATAVVKRVSVRIDTQAAANHIAMSLRRITAASAGTQITAANIPKKHTSTANSVMDIRRTGVTTTLAGSTDSRITSVHTPNAVASTTASGTLGYKEFVFNDDERIILQQGEGFALYQEAAGDADYRVKLLVEWEEVASGSTPSSAGEYVMTTGPISGSLDSGYVYASLFNPSTSGKNYVVKRIGIRANRAGTLVAPGYIPASLRKTTAASDGTQIAVANIPKKHTGTANTTAEVRHTGVTTTFAGDTASRLLTSIVPGVVGNPMGIYESEITYGDELILAPGEGIALYQEATAGDTLTRFRFNIQWNEVDLPATLVEISGTCDAYDQTTDCGDTGEIKVAVNGTLRAETQPTVAGTWTIVDVPLPDNAIVIIFIDGAAAADRAASIFKYDNSGDVNNVRLYKEHLTIGTDGGLNSGQTITVTDLALYDATQDVDVFYDVMTSGTCNGISSFTGLCVDGANVSSQDRLTVLPGNTFTPGQNVISTNLEVLGTLSGTNNITITGGNAVGSGTINMTGGTFLVDGTGNFGSNAAWTFLSLMFGDGVGAATTTATGSGNITVNGNLTISANQTFNAGSKIYIFTGQLQNSDFNMNGTFNANTSTFRYTGVSTSAVEYTDLYEQASPLFWGTDSWTSGSFVPTAGRRLVVILAGFGDFNNDLSGSLTLSDSQGLNWTSIGNVGDSAAWSYGQRAFISSSVPSSTSTTLTADAGAFNIIGYMISVIEVEYSDGTASGFVGDAAMNNDGAESLTLSQSATTGSLGVFVKHLDEGLNAAAPSMDTGWSVITHLRDSDNMHPLSVAVRPNMTGTAVTILDMINGATGSLIKTVGMAFTLNPTLSSSITAANYHNLELVPDTNSTTFTLGPGTFNISGNLTIGNGVNTGVVIDANTNDPIISISGDLIIAANSTYTASNSSAFTISGDFTNGGTFNASNGSIIFNDVGQTSIISGSNTFHNFTVATSGKAVRFIAGTTTTINGLLTVTGSSGNNVTFNSDTGNSSWTINHQGTESITYLTVSWGACHGSSTAIDLTGIGNTNGGNNGTCWNSPEVGISISGVVYQSDGSTPDGTGYTLGISTNGGVGTTTTSNGIGEFSFVSFTQPNSGDMVTIWIDNGDATLVLKYGSSCTGNPNCTGLSLVQNQVRLQSFNGASFTNDDLDACDNNDGGFGCNSNSIGFDSDGTHLTVDADRSLVIAASTTFAPGGSGNVTLNNLIVDGTYTASSGNLTIAGDLDNNGTFTPGSGTVVLNSATQTSIISGNVTFNNFSVNTPGKRVRFTSGETFTINGLLLISGSSGNPVDISSTSGSSAWTINHQGTESINRLVVKWAACHGSSTSISMSSTSLNGGNNGACWVFIGLGGGGASGGGAGGSGGTSGGGAGGGGGGSGGGAGGGGGVGGSGDTGVTFPGTVVSVERGGGGVWTPVNAVYESDDDGANISGANGSGEDYLKATNFGFNIPTGATINGILVTIRKRGGTVGSFDYIVDEEVKIVKANDTIGNTNKADGVTKWATSFTNYNYGGASDLWGESWTSADINNSNFGVVISRLIPAYDFGGGAWIDSISIRVYYSTSTPGGGGGGGSP